MTIEELHDHLFDVLCVVDDICKKNNIRYFLDSGTEIGAVRERDFIAWDDDMDIKVLLEDYEKFKWVMKNELPDYMRFVEPDEMPFWNGWAVRINDERYVIEENNWDTNSRVYVGTDVFIFCKVPDSGYAKTKVLLRTKLLYGLAMGHRYQLNYKKYAPVERVVVFILSRMGKVIPLEWIWNAYLRDFDKWKGRNIGVYFAMNYRIEHIDKMFFNADYFRTTELVPLRNRKFPVPGGYDQELTQIYGDYMTPHQDNTAYIRHLPSHSCTEA